MKTAHKLLLGTGIAITLGFLFTKRDDIIEYILNAQQEAYIQHLHPLVQNDFRKLIHAIEQTGWLVYITSGYRTWAQQALEHAANSQNSQPGYSYHNYGLALDFSAYKGGVWLNKSSSDQEWLNAGIPQLADSMDIGWGGNFANYQDPVHFYIPLAPTSELHDMAIAQFGNNPDNIYGNRLNLLAA